MKVDVRPGINLGISELDLVNREQVEEEVIFDQLSVEMLILAEMGFRALDQVPREDFVVVRSAVLVDSAENLITDEKKAMLAARIWAHEDGGAEMVARYLGIGSEEMGAIIDKLADRDDLIAAYDALDEMDEIIPDKRNIDFIRKAVEVVNRMANEGFSQEDIREEISKIPTKHKKNLGIFVEDDIRRRIMERPGWVEIKNLRSRKMKNDQIAFQTGLPIKDVAKIVNNLILIGEISPHPKGRTRALRFADFCAEVMRLRDLGIKFPADIASRMGESEVRVKQAISRLIDLEIIERISHQEVADKRHNESRVKKKEIVSLRLNTDLTVDEIASKTGLTREQVRNEIRILIEQGVIPRKKQQRREERKERLRRFVKRSYSEDPNKPFSLYRFMRILRTDIDTLRELYFEISAEEGVPPLSKKV